MSRKHLSSRLVSIPKRGGESTNTPRITLIHITSVGMSSVTSDHENKKEDSKKPQSGCTRFSIADEEEKDDQICLGTIKKLTGGDNIGKEKIEEEFNEILKRIFCDGDGQKVANDSREDRRTPMYIQKATLGAIVHPRESTTSVEDERDK